MAGWWRGRRRTDTLIEDFTFRGPRGRLAQLVRAPALQAGGLGFESLTAHHYFQ